MAGVFHLHNGDAARAVLERSGIAGEHGAFAEALHEGPVRGLRPREEWRRERVAFYRSLEGVSNGLPDAALLLERWDRDLERCLAYDEAVLWFEHDLYDQLLLIHHLAWLSRREHEATCLSLVCIGEHAEVPRFLGLGQLQPQAMAALFAQRAPIGAAELALGRRAWQAFCAPEPGRLAALLGEDTRALPFLAAALRRFCQEYPGAEGLSRSERQALRGLEPGARRGAELFRACQDAEESPFMGDLLFWALVDGLAEPPHALLTFDGSELPWAERLLRITADGARVLTGEADALALRGIDRWRGGVHLGAGDPVWRWDEARGFVRSR